MVKNPELISIQGKKTWKDDNNKDKKRPQEITINLLKNGKQIASKKVTEADDWKWSFENLDKYENGKEINYTITEDAAHGYKTEVTGNAKDGFVITNTKEPEKPPTPPEEPPEPPKNPPTSDSNNLSIIILSLFTAGLMILVLLKKRSVYRKNVK